MKSFYTKRCLLLAFIAGMAMQLFAQSDYDPQQAFAPLFYTSGGNMFRAANGAPGPSYWQNRADYEVRASLDTAANTIHGKVLISYTNHSPDSLSFLWLQMDQNISRKDSRANSMNAPGENEKGKNGFQLQKVRVSQNGVWQAAKYIVNDTRMQIRLPHSLVSKKGKLQISVEYNYPMEASSSGGRSGYLDTKNGRLYEVSYWYPRMCVYDDLRGWNTLPFLGGGEFFLDYGDIDYYITLPKGMIVAGAGALLNPEQTLSALQIKRLNRARESDKTVFIRTPEEVISETGRGKKAKAATASVTWHFRMKNTRDVAWAASTAFIWDAAKINLPGGKKSLAMSFYPVESQGDSAWSRATEYLKYSVEIFSKQWYVYPYPVAINVAGPVGGMEYPGITFDHWRAGGKSLWALLSHEIGHNWFPMIVGSNERRDAWMDEGFNTFIDIYAQEEFNGGEYAPKRDGEYAPKGGNPAEEIVPVILKPHIPPIVTIADAFKGADTHPVEYFKTAFGLVLLREEILGKGRFDYAFRKYIRDWAYKHPSPDDFFRAMENGAGEDLSWFWRSWFLNNWKLDQAAKEVKYVDNDPAKGALITIENLEQMVMPVSLKVRETNGHEQTLKLPVEIWQRGGTWTFKYNSTSTLQSVELDPEHQLPDANIANNTWKSPQ